MMKNIIFFLGGALFTVTVTAFATGTLFTDEAKFADWYKSSVINLHNAGVINGYPDGSFKANKEINRAEVAVMLDKFEKYLAKKYQLSANVTEESAKNIAIEFAQKENFPFPSANLYPVLSDDKQWSFWIGCSFDLAEIEHAECPTDIYMIINIDKNTGNIIDFRKDSAA